MKVTVVIPCHNHADMIGRALDSVISQNYRPLNIVVVNDGSQDDPYPEIEQRARQLASDNERQIVYIENEQPTGPSAARNRAIQHMWKETDVFMMLDADDYYLDGKIKKSVDKYLEHDKYIGIVYTDAIIENNQKGTRVHEFRQPYSRLSLESECIISNTPLISKTAISVCGPYDETMRTCEDWELWLRITEKFVAVHIPEPLHVYSVTGKNSSDVVSQEVWNENWSKIREKILQRRNV